MTPKALQYILAHSKIATTLDVCGLFRAAARSVRLLGRKGDIGMEKEQIVHKFRFSMGGFNREDVLQYIAQADASWRERTDSLEGELRELRQQQGELEVVLQSLRSENGTVSAEEARTRASLEESTRALTKVRGELSQAQTKLAAAKGELSRLQTQVAELEPMAKGYEDLKERVAVIDLEAHKQAKAIIDEAQARAEQLRQEGRQWVEGLLGQYEQLRQCAGELDARLRSVGTLTELLKSGDEAAARLREWGTEEDQS